MKQNEFIIIVALCAIIVSGCDPRGEPDPALARAPSILVEATVTKIYLDDLHTDCTEPVVCPKDGVILRLDKIDRSDNPGNLVKLSVGDEVEFNLKYSARRAILREDIPPQCGSDQIFQSGSCVSQDCEGPGCTTSSPHYKEMTPQLEGDSIIYHLPQRSDEVIETILPGLEEGSKIRITIWEPFTNEISTYELIS